MKEREIIFSKNYEEFYPKNYQRKHNTKREQEENNASKNKNKKVTFKEYFPKNRAENQQLHPLEKSTKGFYPKQKSKVKFEKEKPKNEENFENSPNFNDYEEDDYSGLAEIMVIKPTFYPHYMAIHPP